MDRKEYEEKIKEIDKLIEEQEGLSHTELIKEYAKSLEEIVNLKKQVNELKIENKRLNLFIQYSKK